jgi:glycosyltransferase involved in cell wall biosynthesis
MAKGASSRRRPRVLFVGAFAARPGSGVAGGNLSECRALVASSLPKRWDLRLIDSTTPSVPPPPLWKRAGFAFARAVRFAILAIQSRPDAILLFSSGGWSLLEKGTYAVIGRMMNIPSLLCIRDGRFFQDGAHRGLTRRLTSALLRAPRFLPCQGQRQKVFLKDTFAIAEERCPVLGSWLTEPEYLAIGANRRPRHGCPVTMLYVGWLERFKGLFELLEAAAVLAAETGVPPFRLVLVGDGGARDELEQWTRDHGLRDRVFFAGWQTGADKARHFAEADLFVFPSHSEGMPVALIEAMAAGLPAVVTPVGCIPDAVRDGCEVLFVPPEDSAELVKVLRELLAHPTDRERMSRAAYESARERFNVEGVVQHLHELVAEAMKEKHIPSAGAGTPGNWT